MKNTLLLISAAFFIVLISCQNSHFFGNPDRPPAISDMDLGQTAIAIDKEVGKAKADDVSQCDILPIGSKPCGGPWGYLVYSKQAGADSTLKNLAERYDELDKIRNEEEGLLSPCDMAQPPTLTLESGSCKGEGSYAWNPGYILKRNEIKIE